MKIDRRITNGLAWAGVALVVGVPTADLLSAQFSPSAAPAREQVAVVSEVAPVPAPASQRPAAPVSKPAAPAVAETTVSKPAAPAVAEAKPAATPASKPAVTATQTANVVDTFVQSGKPLPSYITGAGTAPAQAAAQPTRQPVAVAAAPSTRTPIVTTPAPAVDPIEVAAIPPQKVAPMPMPLSMRPAPVRVPIAVTAPSVAATVPPADIVLPPELAEPVRPSGTVTAADLEDWETGPLSEFLARRQGSSATVTSDYDPDGFFLDEAPQRPRGDRVIGWDEPGFSFFAD